MSQYTLNVTQSTFAAEVERADLPVLVDFSASWCFPCKALEPVFDQLAELYQGRIKFVKVDADESRDLLTRFVIRSIPTLLLMKDGQAVERTGSITKAELSALLDRHLTGAHSGPDQVAAAAKVYVAFQGDASLQHSALEHLKYHIDAGHIVPFNACEPEQGRFNLMSATVNDKSLAEYERQLGIPVVLAVIEECIANLFLRSAPADAEGERYTFVPGAKDLPVQWLRGLTPGSDLGAVSTKFIAWFLRDISGLQNSLTAEAGVEAKAAAMGVAGLYERMVSGEILSAMEWTSVRNAAIVVLGGGADPASGAVAGIAEALSWPADESGSSTIRGIVQALSILGDLILRKSFTEEQWRARESARAEAVKAIKERKKQPYNAEDLSCLPEMLVVKEVNERADAKWAAQAHQELAERLHAGLVACVPVAASTDVSK